MCHTYLVNVSCPCKGGNVPSVIARGGTRPEGGSL